MGITVVCDVYDSSEVLETKMLTGRSGYDIVVPTGSRIPPLIQAGALQKLDESKLKNLGNLDPKVMQLFASYDPNNEYALPYMRPSWQRSRLSGLRPGACGHSRDIEHDWAGQR